MFQNFFTRTTCVPTIAHIVQRVATHTKDVSLAETSTATLTDILDWYDQQAEENHDLQRALTNANQHSRRRNARIRSRHKITSAIIEIDDTRGTVHGDPDTHYL